MAGYWLGCAAQPADVGTNTTADWTYIPDFGAAEAAGKITKIQIFCAVGGNFEFGVFSKSGSIFTDKYSVTINDIPPGYSEFVDPTDFSQNDLLVAVGDWIGHYSLSGTIKRSTEDLPGYWSDSGDQIGDKSPSAFNLAELPREIQFRVWIETEATEYSMATIVVPGNGILIGVAKNQTLADLIILGGGSIIATSHVNKNCVLIALGKESVKEVKWL